MDVLELTESSSTAERSADDGSAAVRPRQEPPVIYVTCQSCGSRKANPVKLHSEPRLHVKFREQANTTFLGATNEIKKTAPQISAKVSPGNCFSVIKDSSKSLLYSTHLTWKSNQPTKMLGAKGRQSVDEHLFSPVSPGPFFLTKETQEDISNSSPFGFMSPPKALLRDASHVHGGRHRPRMNSRGSSPEKKNDVELRLEVSEFIKHADSLTGDSEDKDKSSERSSTGETVRDLSDSLSGSLPALIGSTWIKILQVIRSFMRHMFMRRKPELQFQKTNFRTMWMSPEYTDLFSPGNLVIKQKIGSGSFGIVYLVEDKKTSFKYAIKCVRKLSKKKKKLSRRASETEFFVWRETAGHPHIMPLIAAFQTRSACCFVMEFVPTGSLSHLLARQDKPLKEDEVRRIASQLAHALYSIHRMGFLHRDVSCSNVLVTQRCDVLLIDFGSSVIGNVASSRAGTLAYMAPEVLAGRTSGPGADWWSYGIVLFALFEGTTPMHIYANRYKIDLRKFSLRSRLSVMRRVSVPISPLLQTDKRNLLKEFLREDPKARLGVRHKQDFNLIRQHAYFANVNWRSMDEALDRMLRRKYNLPDTDSGDNSTSKS